MEVRARILRLVQRFVLRTARTPLARLWALVYRAVARACIGYLTRGADSVTVYLRGGASGGGFLPGISDVDTVLVFGAEATRPGAASARARRRWDRLMTLAPKISWLFDWPFIHDEQDLHDLAGAMAPTFGLDDPDGAERAAYFGPGRTVDWIRRVERPELDSTTAGWALVAGPERRPPEPPRDDWDHVLAAWLELVYWWRQASFFVCAQPDRPRAARNCVNLVAGPARAWLRVAHGERSEGREDALRRALRRLPEEEALRLALDLESRLTASPAPSLAAVLPALLRFTRRVAALIEEELTPAGSTEVRLVGEAPEGELPLADWPSLVAPVSFDERFAPAHGDPGDPAVLREAMAAHRPRRYMALGDAGLMVLPGRPFPRTRMRGLKCPASDPVSFALVRGARTASFPEAPGLAARDVARRAVAEHRVWLRTGVVAASPLDTDPEPPADEQLARLLTAARAALFMESIRDGDAELALTPEATAERLEPRAGPVALDAVAAYRASLADGRPPAATTVRELCAAVLALPAYAAAPAPVTG